MKKMVLVLLALSLSYNGSAQDATGSEKVKFGIKAGLNLANTTGSGTDFFLGTGESTENRFGLSIGGLVEYKISEKFSLQTELIYSQQGFKRSYSDEDFQLTQTLDYLNIPLLAKYYVTDKFNIEVGPQIGFLLAAKYKEKEEGEKYEEDAKEFFKSTDIGLNFGVGYQLENGLGVSARYNLGLIDVFDFDRSSETDNREGEFEIKNSVFNLSFFYTF